MPSWQNKVRACTALIVCSVTIFAFANSAMAEPPSVTINSPTDGSVLTNSRFPLNYSLTGISGGMFAKSRCYFDNSATLPSGFPVSCWAGLDIDAGLANGEHTIEVIAWDSADTIASDSVTFSINDSTPPTAQLELLPSADPSNSAVSFQSTMSGTNSATCWIDDQPETLCGGIMSNADPTSGIFTPVSLTSGTHTAHMRATDPAGNTATDELEFTVADTTAPSLSDLTPANGATVTSSPLGFQFESNDANISIECNLDDAGYEPCELDYSTVDCFAWPAGPPFTCSTALYGLANGEHSIAIRATDQAGNVSTPVESVFAVEDTTGPTVSLAGVAEGSTITDGYYLDVTADTSAGRFECTINGGPYEGCWFSSDPEKWYSARSGELLLQPTQSGPVTVGFRVTDPMGRVATAQRSVVIADVTPPEAYFVTPSAGATVSSPFRVVFDGEEALDITRCSYSLDNGSYETCDASPGLDAVTATPGAHTINVRYTDWVGNATVISRNIIVSGTPAPPPGTDSAGPGQQPPDKVVPKILPSKIKPKLRGKYVTLPIGFSFGTDAASCAGSATLKVMNGKKLLAKMTVKLTYARGVCSAKASRKLKASKLRGKKLRVSATVGPETSSFANATASMTVKIPK